MALSRPPRLGQRVEPGPVQRAEEGAEEHHLREDEPAHAPAERDVDPLAVEAAFAFAHRLAEPLLDHEHPAPRKPVSSDPLAPVAPLTHWLAPKMIEQQPERGRRRMARRRGNEVVGRGCPPVSLPTCDVLLGTFQFSRGRYAATPLLMTHCTSAIRAPTKSAATTSPAMTTCSGLSSRRSRSRSLRLAHAEERPHDRLQRAQQRRLAGAGRVLAHIVLAHDARAPACAGAACRRRRLDRRRAADLEEGVRQGDRPSRPWAACGRRRRRPATLSTRPASASCWVKQKHSSLLKCAIATLGA